MKHNQLIILEGSAIRLAMLDHSKLVLSHSCKEQSTWPAFVSTMIRLIQDLSRPWIWVMCPLTEACVSAKALDWLRQAETASSMWYEFQFKPMRCCWTAFMTAPNLGSIRGVSRGVRLRSMPLCVLASSSRLPICCLNCSALSAIC